MAEADSIEGIAQEINRHAVALANRHAAYYFRSFPEDDPRSLIKNVEIFSMPDPGRKSPFGVKMNVDGLNIEKDDRIELRQIGKLSVREALAERPELLGTLITSYARRGENFFKAFLNPAS